MDYNRAQKIVDANIEIEVLYNKNSVWIKNLDKSSGMAKVENMKTSQEMQVPISELQEQNTVQ